MIILYSLDRKRKGFLLPKWKIMKVIMKLIVMDSISHQPLTPERGKVPNGFPQKVLI
jgi:hypothetical protein